MAPLLFPKDPQFQTMSEEAVWRRLRDTLRPEDALIANYRLTDANKDHEADLIAVLPGVGVIVIEVKGAGTTCRDGQWYMWREREGREVPIYPVDQARNARYAIRDYVQSDPRWKAA